MSTDKHFPDDVFFGAGADEALPEIEQGSTAQLSVALWGDEDDEDAPMSDMESISVMRDDDRGVGDLGHLMEGSVQNLDWLEVTEQDADRLPKNTQMDVAIPELEDAWGTSEVQARYHGTDRADHAYEKSLTEEAQPQKTAAEMREILRLALRQSAAGQPLKQILTYAIRSMEGEGDRLRSALKLVQYEHGLAGRVFLRADAYPGCDQGKWAKEKFASGSKYVVAKEKCKGCVHANSQTGSCSVFARKLVAEVPWAEARALYTPILEATGRVVPDGEPQAALKKAFTAPLPASVPDTSHLPTHKAPSQRVTSEEARAAFAAAPKQAQVVIDGQEMVEAGKIKLAQLKIAGWVKAEMLTHADGIKLVKSGLPAHEMLRRAASIITQPVGASGFSGVENDVRPQPATVAVANAALAAAAAAPKPEPVSIAHREPAARLQAAQKQLFAWHKKGWLSREDASRLVNSKADPRFLLKAGASIIAKSHGMNPYTGVANDASVKVASKEAVWSALRQKEAEAKQAQTQVDATILHREHEAQRDTRLSKALMAKVNHIEAAIARGIKGQALRNLITRSIPRDKLAELQPVLGPLLERTGALKAQPPKAHTYTGARYTATHTPDGKPRVASQAEVKDCVAFCRRHLHSGYYGTALNEKLRGRFAAHVLKAATPELAQLRKALERKAAQQASKHQADMEIVLNAPGYDAAEFNLGGGDMDNIGFEDDTREPSIDDISFGGMTW